MPEGEKSASAWEGVQPLKSVMPAERVVNSPYNYIPKRKKPLENPWEGVGMQFQKLDFLQTQFKQLGFVDIQARIYLTLMRLGKATMSDIARLIGRSHVTVLFHLKILEERKLVVRESAAGKCKKSYRPVPPRLGLWQYVRNLREDVEHKELLLHETLEGFETAFGQLEERPEVRYIEGDDMPRRIQLEIAGTKFDELYNFTNADDYVEAVPKKIRNAHNQTFRAHRRKIKMIYTSVKGAFLESKWRQIERFFIPKDFYDFPGEILLFADKAIIASYKPKKTAVVIRDPSIHKILKTLFRLGIKGARCHKEHPLK